MRSVYTRSRWLLWALPALLIATLSSSAGAQGLFGTGARVGSFLESVPGFGSLDVGSMRLTPSVRVGHQWIGLNFNLPTLAPVRGTGVINPIDIQLRDAHVWVGSVGLEGQLFPALSFFVNAEGNPTRSVGAVTTEEPLQFAFGLAPYQWNASNLEWWSVEGGLAYRISNDLTVFAGLRREHLSFGLDNPRDVFGLPINFVQSNPGVFTTGTATADFQLKLWVPYLGLRFTGLNYRASLAWTPFVNAAVKVPDRFIRNIFNSSLLNSSGFDWNYSMFRTGTEIEGDFQYDLKLSSNFSISAWAKGSWLRIRGRGNLDEVVNQFTSLPGRTIFASLSGTGDETATLGRYQTAMGLGAELNF